ncbi:peptidase S8/S53 domain-containing protein [Paraphysoderma sedebokerense]|nr:peptidase S8/S53 domain-containing protein [Paraphysoderma sedebokerense]
MYLTSNEKQVLESMNEVEVVSEVTEMRVALPIGARGLNKRDEDKEAWKLEEFSPQAGNGQSYTQKCSSELWNLDRLDDRLDGLYRFTGLAADVDCYILDTGVMGSHSEFEGRVRERVNFADDNSVDDIYGHGTLVAGVTAGRTYGVAKMCNVISVKVMNGKGQGTTNTALAGLNWAVSKIKERKRKSVLNLSLSGPKDVVFDEAVLAAAKDNVPIIVAAGNSGADSCQESPAGVNHQNVLTVAAINRADERPGFSNFGSCVDVYAPGSEVKTASQKGNAETRTVDGTSVATPHVTGVIAQLLHAGYQSQEVTNLIRGHAFVNRIKGDLKGSPNKILQAYYVGKDK